MHYFNGQIGTTECAARTRLKAKKPRLTDRVWYQEYMTRHKIKRLVNRIDLLLSQNKRHREIKQ